MTDPRHAIDPTRPFTAEPIAARSVWHTLAEAAVLFLFLFVLPALAGVVR